MGFCMFFAISYLWKECFCCVILKTCYDRDGFCNLILIPMRQFCFAISCIYPMTSQKNISSHISQKNIKEPLFSCISNELVWFLTLKSASKTADVFISLATFLQMVLVTRTPKNRIYKALHVEVHGLSRFFFLVEKAAFAHEISKYLEVTTFPTFEFQSRTVQ